MFWFLFVGFSFFSLQFSKHPCVLSLKKSNNVIILFLDFFQLPIICYLLVTSQSSPGQNLLTKQYITETAENNIFQEIMYVLALTLFSLGGFSVLAAED